MLRLVFNENVSYGFQSLSLVEKAALDVAPESNFKPNLYGLGPDLLATLHSNLHSDLKQILDLYSAQQM